MDVGFAGSRRAPRIGHDDGELGLALFRRPNAVESHGVALGHIAADDENHVGMVNVLVAAGWAVASQTGAIAGDGCGHA
ncbi:hypothetical protein HRbin36_02814 [bacterium HR36]|nr:hypothetical protein HRbin36_02814 [bacterium HR36]